MRVKCNVCDFVWIFENTLEKNKENNEFSCNHMNAHTPTETPLFWNDLEPLSLEIKPLHAEVIEPHETVIV